MRAKIEKKVDQIEAILNEGYFTARVIVERRDTDDPMLIVIATDPDDEETALKVVKASLAALGLTPTGVTKL